MKKTISILTLYAILGTFSINAFANDNTMSEDNSNRLTKIQVDALSEEERSSYFESHPKPPRKEGMLNNSNNFKDEERPTREPKGDRSSR